MKSKLYSSPRGEAKKDRRKFIRFLRRVFKHMPAGYNLYLKPADYDPLAKFDEKSTGIDFRITEKEERKKIRQSRSIANGPDAQRDAIQEERKQGKFDHKKHLEESPIGQAIKKGFPKIDRASDDD